MGTPVRLGRYPVKRRIGSGSFATVWLAHDEVLDAPVAVKVLAENWVHRLDVRQRFEEEARILRRADSDRVVRVHDIGELEDGRPYFVMTYADRGTLADRLADGPLPVPVALRYAADVARGLAVLHEVGVIHRDITPANVLLRSGRAGVGDRVLVADLGLAKAAAQGSGFTLTVGTPGYMAPEQASGSGVTKRTDVYAVGALLWHLLTGAPPVPDAPLPRVTLPRVVDTVLRQALERRPEERFPSAGSLADALDAAMIDLARGPPGRAGPARAAPTRPASAGPVAGPDPEATVVVRPDRERMEPAAGRDVVPVRQPDRERTRPPGAGAPGGPYAVGRRPGRRLVLLAAVLLLATGGAAAYLLRHRAGTVTVTAASGLHVSVPASWGRQEQAAGWDLTPLGAAGHQGSALLVARDVAAWRDPTSAVPGVFVGVAGGVPAGRLWAAGAGRTCPYIQETRELRSGLTGTVRRHQCPGARVRLTEAVLTRRGSADVIFVQVREPLGDDHAVSVLDSVTAPVS